MFETPEPIIYQLKVVLLDVSPMIWRRLLVCSTSTITDLHYILQFTMGWSDDHLNRFRIHGKQYGIEVRNRFLRYHALRKSKRWLLPVYSIG